MAGVSYESAGVSLGIPPTENIKSLLELIF